MVIKDERGFSFVELMTIITILCVVTIAAYPLIVSVLKSSKTNLYKDNIKELERAGIAWATKNASDLPDDNKDARFLTIKKLYKEGYINDENVPDPRNNGEYISGCIVIKKNKDNQYKAKFHELSCSKAGREYVPKIKVVKDALKTHEVNSEKVYQFPRLEATSVTGESLEVPYPIIKKDGALTTYVEATKVGEVYQLIYTVKDPGNGLSAKVEFTVKIVDTKNPVITVNGETSGYEEEIILGSDYQIPKAIIGDNSLESLSVHVSTNLNTNMLGNYEVVYTATDSHGNMGIFVLKLKVVKDEIPKENQIIIDNASVLPGDGVLKKQKNSEYIFQGMNPNNYIQFNNELWRIMKIDSKGIKIIKDTPVTNMKWSDKNSTHFNDSNIYTYLNQTYLNLVTDKKYINDKQQWSIASIDLEKTQSLDQLIREENKNKTRDSLAVGMITLSDYLSASTSQDCKMDGLKCTSYLTKTNPYWTSNITSDKLHIYGLGQGIASLLPDTVADVYPVLYLSNYQTLMGTGSQTDPYVIQN